jgi:hypothetical protein
MSTRIRSFASSFAVLGVIALWSGDVVGADMFSGTWRLNVAKSKYSPGPAPRSGTTILSSVDGGLKFIVDGVNAEGRKTHSEYMFRFDGRDYPQKPMLDGKPDPTGADMISAKRVDDYTYETTAKLKGKVLNVTRVVVSKDGKTRTNTVTGTNAQGQTVSNTVVYEKQ